MKRSFVKVDFNWNNFQFKGIKLIRYSGVYAPVSSTSQVISQLLRQKYPTVVFQMQSESFSGGNSITVYVSPLHCDENTFHKIESDVNTFRQGNFNGMYDSYDFFNRDCGICIKLDIDGLGEQKIEFSAMYLHVEYKPKWGTQAYEEYEQFKEKD